MDSPFTKNDVKNYVFSQRLRNICTRWISIKSRHLVSKGKYLSSHFFTRGGKREFSKTMFFGVLEVALPHIVLGYIFYHLNYSACLLDCFCQFYILTCQLYVFFLYFFPISTHDNIPNLSAVRIFLLSFCLTS